MQEPKPSTDQKTPEAVQLKTAEGKMTTTDIASVDPTNIQNVTPNKPLTPKRTLHLSGRATFVGLGIALSLVVLMLVGVFLVLRNKNTKPVVPTGYNSTNLTVEDVQKLNGKTATIGESFGTLIVSPFSTFKNKIQVDKDASVGGQLNVVGSSSLAGLTAAATTLSSLQVAGNSTLNQGTFKGDLNVSGTTTLLNGANVNNSINLNGALNVIGSASISGSLTVSTINFKSGNLNGPLSINGHYISGGPGPNMVYSTATLGTAGTASVSGNDTTGTIFITPGTSPCSPNPAVDHNSCGLIGTITFGAGYAQTPRINLTPIGREAGLLQYYITRTSAGFKLYTNNTVTSPTVGNPNPQIGFDYFIAQ